VTASVFAFKSVALPSTWTSLDHLRLARREAESPSTEFKLLRCSITLWCGSFARPTHWLSISSNVRRRRIVLFLRSCTLALYLSSVGVASSITEAAIPGLSIALTTRVGQFAQGLESVVSRGGRVSVRRCGCLNGRRANCRLRLPRRSCRRSRSRDLEGYISLPNPSRSGTTV